MIALLVSAALIGVSQTPQKSMFREVIPNPTGNNGYEEYLMACDVIQSSKVGLLVTATPESFEATIKEYEAPLPKGVTEEQLAFTKMEKPTIEAYEAAKKYRKYTVLQLRREALAVAGKALDLLNKGNRKPVFDPRTDLSVDTLFPEYAQMKALGRLAVAGAYVAYADGQPSRGTQYLCDAIILGQNLSNGILISRLVGVAVQAIAFAAFERFLPVLSAKDAAQLEALAPALIENPPAAAKTIAREFKFLEATLDELFKQKEAFLMWSSDEQSASEKSAIELMKRLGPGDQQQVIALCKKNMMRVRETLLASYKRPESEWDTVVETGETEYDPKRTVNNVNELAEYVSVMMSPVFAQVGSVEVRNRAQIRLLGLAGSVIRFKWENDRWPSKLSEAAGEKAVFDPASGEEFQFLVEANGFKVFSKGTKNTGEIALKYRKQAEGQNVVPPPTR